MEWLAEPQAWIALVSLTALEIVLGIDNIVFITILTGRLPEAERARARRWGLMLAMVTRIALLGMLAWIMRLSQPLFTVLESEISGRDLVLLAGGLFLIAKSTLEIHHKLEEAGRPTHGAGATVTMASVLAQIAILDVVFSLDSVVTAVGMARHVPVMVLAIVIAVIVMILFVGPVSRFVESHPTFKILALSFLLLIGVALVGEALDLEIPKGYIYFAMGFSLAIELLNLRVRSAEKRRAAAQAPE